MALWDLYQHSQIRTARKAQALGDDQALRRDQRIERQVEEVDERVEELATIVEALWTLCRDRLGLTDDALTAAVGAIVEERQRAAAAGPARCTACQAALSPDRDTCQFCGAAVPGEPSPFDG